ncbi:hypothetical protein [Cupriavidus pinatubonensis]|uniref:hypothetical protein n=1 Tax=Cupriavidus pinatubonensis TaxID=248026 RepID=UPI001127FD1D|nr:hypothetical protein [Cupriavidus pinatubonensis]
MVALLENPRTAPLCMAPTAQLVVSDTFFLCNAQKPLDTDLAFPRIAIVAAHQSNQGSALTHHPRPGWPMRKKVFRHGPDIWAA